MPAPAPTPPTVEQRRYLIDGELLTWDGPVEEVRSPIPAGEGADPRPVLGSYPLSVSDALRAFSIRTLVAAGETPRNKELLREMLRERSSRFLSTDYLF